MQISSFHLFSSLPLPSSLTVYWKIRWKMCPRKECWDALQQCPRFTKFPTGFQYPTIMNTSEYNNTNKQREGRGTERIEGAIALQIWLMQKLRNSIEFAQHLRNRKVSKSAFSGFEIGFLKSRTESRKVQQSWNLFFRIVEKKPKLQLVLELVFGNFFKNITPSHLTILKSVDKIVWDQSNVIKINTKKGLWIRKHIKMEQGQPGFLERGEYWNLRLLMAIFWRNHLAPFRKFKQQFWTFRNSRKPNFETRIRKPFWVGGGAWGMNLCWICWGQICKK